MVSQGKHDVLRTSVLVVQEYHIFLLFLPPGPLTRRHRPWAPGARERSRLQPTQDRSWCHVTRSSEAKVSSLVCNYSGKRAEPPSFFPFWKTHVSCLFMDNWLVAAVLCNVVVCSICILIRICMPVLRPNPSTRSHCRCAPGARDGSRLKPTQWRSWCHVTINLEGKVSPSCNSGKHAEPPLEKHTCFMYAQLAVLTAQINEYSYPYLSVWRH